jgi:hypothetical protein
LVAQSRGMVKGVRRLSLARPPGCFVNFQPDWREKKSTLVAITTPSFGEMAETLLKLRMNLSPPQGDPSYSLSAGYRFGLRWAVSSFSEGTVFPCVARSPSRIWGRLVLTRPSSPPSEQALHRLYEPDGGNCDLNVVMWDSADDSGDSPARVRLSLNADQRVFIDSPDHKSVTLQCGDFADTLKIVENKLLNRRRRSIGLTRECACHGQKIAPLELN